MDPLISQTIDFVKQELQCAEAGHDWFHVERVYRTSMLIHDIEGGNALVIALAALLHDIADPKFHNGNEAIGPEKAERFLKSVGVAETKIAHVKHIIEGVSYKNSFDNKRFTSLEMNIIQDADRLDAIGAIGIARAFTYGGFKNRTLYDPEIMPVTEHTKESYKKTTAPTINHFYEKLLLLKDKMNTVTGKKLAEERHDFMKLYLEQFYKEWRGSAV
ncbi:MAG: hypothetical protein K0R26_1695 [Bacteroidota bacterium]|jgi:uncharacterized protein|nr:hypothetical protein [Bacteroidota bacterium]